MVTIQIPLLWHLCIQRKENLSVSCLEAEKVEMWHKVLEGVDQEDLKVEQQIEKMVLVASEHIFYLEKT